ncbi:MAG: hypothetical protein K2I36_03360 [Ureaplasma sp.]|nr:hypothetical protein [Ureaplasma sp.]
MSRSKLTKIDWKEIFHSKNLETISNAIDLFFDNYESLISKFEHKLSEIKSKRQIYIFPSTDIDISNQMKLIVIFGFEIIYQITNEELIKTTINKFVNNEKFITPDVFFYILSLMNETLIYINYQSKISQFMSLINLIEDISSKYSNTLKVDLEQLDELKIEMKSKSKKVTKHND